MPTKNVTFVFSDEIFDRMFELGTIISGFARRVSMFHPGLVAECNLKFNLDGTVEAVFVMDDDSYSNFQYKELIQLVRNGGELKSVEDNQIWQEEKLPEVQIAFKFFDYEYESAQLASVMDDFAIVTARVFPDATPSYTVQFSQRGEVRVAIVMTQDVFEKIYKRYRYDVKLVAMGAKWCQ